MSYGYQEYGGNPYDSGAGAGGQYSQRPELQTHASSNYSQAASPAQGYGAANPYATTTTTSSYQQSTTTYGATTGVQQDISSTQPTQHTGYGNTNAYASGPGTIRVEPPPTLLSNPDFLSRVEAIRGQIRELTSNIGEIGSVHQRLLSSPDTSHAQLDNLVTNTQILNTRIRDQIRALEADALKSGDNTTKKSQIRTLKGHFKTQLEDFQKEEQTYRRRYQEQIQREYRIVNPEASDSEVREAGEADWGNEGVFQQALKSNRTGAASSALGNVRARHNDIQRIEQTLLDLAQMFQDLAAQVELQEPQVEQMEDKTKQVQDDTHKGTQQLDKGIQHAKTRRKLKWWCFGISVLIICIIVAVIGGYFGYQASHKNKKRAITVEITEDELVQRAAAVVARGFIA